MVADGSRYPHPKWAKGSVGQGRSSFKLRLSCLSKGKFNEVLGGGLVSGTSIRTLILRLNKKSQRKLIEIINRDVARDLG